jgi:hypothetical protein
MAKWEQYRTAMEQEEILRRKCYQKLLRVKEFLKNLKEDENTDTLRVLEGPGWKWNIRKK